MQRLFFALKPDAVTTAQLKRFMDELPEIRGRRVAAGKLHITLHFLGDTPPLTRDQLSRFAGALTARSFSLTLDRCGWWRGPQILWLAPRRCPEALQGLVDRLADGIKSCGLNVDPRPYQPHMTLFRKVREPVRLETEPDIAWQVASFCLVASQPRPEGVQYEVLDAWKLPSAPTRQT